MGTTYRYLTTVQQASAVLEWFRILPERPIETRFDAGSSFFFRDFGQRDVDVAKSPVVSVFLPVRKRGVLNTIGEVHFLATPLSAVPKLNDVSKRFRRWLAVYPCVFSRRPDFDHQWDYYLEGGTRNWDIEIFALPEGIEALRRGEYFVAADDNDVVLDRVCRALELRGVEGICC